MLNRLSDIDEIQTKRKMIASVCIALILVLTLTDLISDQGHGVDLEHLVIESLIIMSCTLSLFVLWARTMSASLMRIQNTESELRETREDLAQWRTRAQELLRGLGTAIQEQFSEWNLTESEQEVGLLLLKGLSVKEIAAIRECSDKTVRHHASKVYQKSGLQGRSELSAFFLEDLLLPISESPTND